MTRAKAKALGAVGPGAVCIWSDPTIPDLSAEFKTSGIDGPAFLASFTELIGEYRVLVQHRSGQPQVAAVVAWMLDVAQRLPHGSAWQEIESAMPPLAESAAWYAAFKSERDWARLLRDRTTDHTREALMVGAESLRQQKRRSGRPDQKPRDKLLAGVVEYLKAQRMPVGDAQRLAETILIKCRVAVPEESVPRAARRGR